MATINVQTTSEDGDIDNSPLTVFTGQTILTCAAYDSTETHQRSTFFFFNTADSVTGIPSNAVIDSVTLWFYVTAFPLQGTTTDELWYSPDGSLGSTLDSGDFNLYKILGYPHIKHVHPPISPTHTGWWSEPLFDPNTGKAEVNRSGYTNVILELVTQSPTDTLSVQAFENPSGNKAYLEITYHMLPGIVTTYSTGSVNAGAAGISFSSLATPERDGRWAPDEHVAPGPPPPIVAKVFRSGGLSK